MDELTFLDRKILLVDDDTAILKLLEVVLKKEKCYGKCNRIGKSK